MANALLLGQASRLGDAQGVGVLANSMAQGQDMAAQRQQMGQRNALFQQQQEDRQREMQMRQQADMGRDVWNAAAPMLMSDDEAANAQTYQQALGALRQKYPDLQAPDQYPGQQGLLGLVAPYNKELADKIYENKFAPKQAALPNSAQEYQFAQKQGYKGSYQDWMREQKTAAAQFRFENPVAPKARPLPNPAVTKLSDAGADLETLSRLDQSFQPGYGGHAILGDLDNTIGRIAGDDTGQAQWWQDYQSYQNEVRNRLFGSALTLPEKGEFTKAMITPRMEAGEIKKNLGRQAEIATRAAKKLARSYQAQGYNQEAIDELIPPALYTEQAAAPGTVGLPEGVTEDDIAETMRANGMTRDQVLEAIGG